MSIINDYFLRPPRQTYYQHDLGSQLIEYKQKKVQRIDFAVKNSKNCMLSASYFDIYSQSNNYSQRKKRNQDRQIFSEVTAIYLHTHHGSKIEGLNLKEAMIDLNINYCIFDFAGYGNSEGQFVTLGINQSEDIQSIISQLQTKFKQKKFILWGRSMGAVAAILYLSQTPSNDNIICSIFDSPFSSLKKSILQIASDKTGVSQKIISPFLYFVKKSIEHALDFSKLELDEKIKNVKRPGLFITSKNDKFIKYSHSQTLYKSYGGEKELHYIEKDHNQHRSISELFQIFNFLKKNIMKDRLKVKWARKQNQISNQISSETKCIQSARTHISSNSYHSSHPLNQYQEQTQISSQNSPASPLIKIRNKKLRSSSMSTIFSKNNITLNKKISQNCKATNQKPNRLKQLKDKYRKEGQMKVSITSSYKLVCR